MRWRVRVGYPVAVAYWILAPPNLRTVLFGASVSWLGLIVRAAASGYLRKDRELAMPALMRSRATRFTWEARFLPLGLSSRDIRGGPACWSQFTSPFSTTR